MPKRANSVGLDDMKAGDVVGLHGKIRNRVKGWRLATVARTTPTQIIVEGRRFRRSDGREIDKWAANPDWIAALTHRIVGRTVADLISEQETQTHADQ